MVWNCITNSGVNLTGIDTTPKFPIGTIVQGRDATYGAGEFIYLPGVASTAGGDVVEYDTYAGTTTRWAGTANRSKPLAVAMAANTSTTGYGWYQIAGAALVNLGGDVAAGANVFWQATAVVDDAAVNGKQMLGAFFSAAGSSGGQGVVILNRPHAQGQVS